LDVRLHVFTHEGTRAQPQRRELDQELTTKPLAVTGAFS